MVVPEESIAVLRAAVEKSLMQELDPRAVLSASGVLDMGLTEAQRERALGSARWIDGRLHCTVEVESPVNLVRITAAI